MDTHSFSEPRPVKDADIPTWQVDVLRDKGGDTDAAFVVTTLTVNERNLPPRVNKKKKNKIVWKLPDDYETVPRFGEAEKKRLWELFQQEKKARRKQQKQQQQAGKGGASKETSQNDLPHNRKSDLEAKTPLSTVAQEAAGAVSATTATAESTPPQSEKGDDEQETTTVPSRSPPPPPGFGGLGSLSISYDNDVQRPAPGPISPATSPSKLPSSAPPGLEPHQQHGPPQPLSPPTAATSPHATTTAYVPPSQRRRRRYFYSDAVMDAQHQPPNVSSFLATRVASTFLQCMQSNCLEWLDFYTIGTAHKTLLMGNAQAICRTTADQAQQVQSLAAGSQWDCQGTTLQPVPVAASHTNSPNILSSSTLPQQGFLVVLNGRTIQKAECWSYNLSLVLVPVVDPVNDADLLIDHEKGTAVDTGMIRGTSPLSAADSIPTRRTLYQIQNDVLSLFPMTTGNSTIS